MSPHHNMGVSYGNALGFSVTLTVDTRAAAYTISVTMRTKPIQRDEIRFDGLRITTVPINSVREGRRGDLNPIPKLWAPLLHSLDQAEKKLWEGWVQRGLASADTPPKPIKAPHPDLSSGKLRCRYCGVKFYRTDRSAYTYCSDKCAGAAHSAAMVKARSQARAAARAGRKCETCGKPIKAQRSTMRFCSVRCRVAAHRNGDI